VLTCLRRLGAQWDLNYPRAIAMLKANSAAVFYKRRVAIECGSAGPASFAAGRSSGTRKRQKAGNETSDF
jgi:hypothetical protein